MVMMHLNIGFYIYFLDSRTFLFRYLAHQFPYLCEKNRNTTISKFTNYSHSLRKTQSTEMVSNWMRCLVGNVVENVCIFPSVLHRIPFWNWWIQWCISPEKIATKSAFSYYLLLLLWIVVEINHTARYIYQ